MKHAVLVQVHKQPPQVAGLCVALRHPDFDIFVSIDEKSDLEAFRRVLPDVYFIRNRVNVRWACFSQVQATLNAM